MLYTEQETVRGVAVATGDAALVHVDAQIVSTAST